MNFTGEHPLIVHHGVGVDSTAKLLGMAERGLRPDLILFADVGSEKPETYEYIPVLNAWLLQQGWPTLTVVRYEPTDFKHWPPYHTIEENNLTNGTLPSIAFGFQRKNCSLKWKVSPQEAFIRGRYNRKTRAYEGGWASDHLASGGKVERTIGYDASPRERVRYAHAQKTRGGKDVDEWSLYRYPLIEWGWDRARCIEVIRHHGLPVPVKSACFFCPASKPHELHDLSADHLRRIVVMEARAAPRCEGWMDQDQLDQRHAEQMRKFHAGQRKTKPKRKTAGQKGLMRGLWATKTMTNYIHEENLLPREEVRRLWFQVPKDLIAYQDRYAEVLTAFEARHHGRPATLSERFAIAEALAI